MRLLFVVNHSDFFLSHRLPLAEAAQDQGWDIHVATMYTPASEKLEELGLLWHPIPLQTRRLNPLLDIILLCRLYRLYRQIRPDLVHHVTLKPVIYGGIAARLAGVRSVVNALSGLGYVFTSEGARARLLRLVVMRILRFAFGHPNSRLVLQNQDDVDAFSTLTHPLRIELIRGSGVNLDRFAPSSETEGRPMVLLPSRMLWDKGVREFVEAARILRRRGVDVRFVLAGEPDENNPRAIPRSQLADWVEENVVDWYGHREDMSAVYHEAHVVCLPSYREGLPKVLIEAGACQRAVVATDVPGCREIIRHGENGLLVPPRNSEALAESIAWLLNSKSERYRMATKGRHIVKSRYRIEHIVQDTMEMYKDLVT